jgi:integrase
VAKRIYHPIHERIFQHKVGGNYYVYVGGKEISLKTSDDKKALENLRFLDDQVEDVGAKAFAWTLGQVLEKFLEYKEPDLRPRTIKEYEIISNTFKKHGFSKTKLAKINQRSWEKFCNKAKTIRDFQNHRNLLHQVLVWSEMKGLLKGVPTIKKPKHKRRKRKVLPPAHMTLLFQAAMISRGNILVYLTFLAFHGPRGGEVRKLKWINVSFEKKSALFTGDTVKTDEEREIPLNDLLIGLLKKHLLKQQDLGIRSPYVFANARDPKRFMSESGFKTAWKTALRKANLLQFGYTPHDLRATYEAWLGKSKEFSSTQKRKMVGADEDVQNRIYITLGADDLRGAENVVQVPDLVRLLESTGIGREGVGS